MNDLRKVIQNMKEKFIQSFPVHKWRNRPNTTKVNDFNIPLSLIEK
jgi:hypothetical protein